MHNLADDPEYQEELNRLRAELESQMKSVGDLGLLPEREMHERARSSTPYEIAKNSELNPLTELLSAAKLANQMDESQIPALVTLLDEKDSAVRWWGAVGLVSLGDKAASAKAHLTDALGDNSPDVRVVVAEALANVGETNKAIPVLKGALADPSVFVRLAALKVAGRMGERARPLVPAIQRAKMESSQHKHAADYVGRMVDYLPDQIGR